MILGTERKDYKSFFHASQISNDTHSLGCRKLLWMDCNITEHLLMTALNQLENSGNHMFVSLIINKQYITWMEKLVVELESPHKNN